MRFLRQVSYAPREAYYVFFGLRSDVEVRTT
jgi:hypothetical protein